MTKTFYKITPDPSLMEDIGATSFTLAEAIVELVANSIDARPLREDGIPAKNLVVEVSVSSEEVIIVDNACGMTENILVEAVRLGAKMDNFLGVRKRKGMYGLGLKTAAASIGGYWAVLTRTTGSTTDSFLEFDLEDYAKKSDWEIEVENKGRELDSVLGDRESGTAIIIKKLRDDTGMAAAVTKKLGDAYSPHILSGDVITVNGVKAGPTQYTFKEDQYVKFDEIVGGPLMGQMGWHVRGWVGIDSQTHNDGEYGFNLYRENQLIETWDKSWFRAHLMTSRIIGEAHLDFMPVNFNKQGFKTQSQEWRLTAEHMRLFLKPVVKSSSEASRGKGDKTKLERAIQGMVKAMKGLSNIEPDDAEASDELSKNAQGRTQNDKDSKKILINVDSIIFSDNEIIPTWIAEDLDSDLTPWDYLSGPCGAGKTEVQAILNSSSLLYKNTSDTNILGLLALSECITRYLVEKCNVNPKQAREMRDKWIYAALSVQKEKREVG